MRDETRSHIARFLTMWLFDGLVKFSHELNQQLFGELFANNAGYQAYEKVSQYTALNSIISIQFMAVMAGFLLPVAVVLLLHFAPNIACKLTQAEIDLTRYLLRENTLRGV